MQPEANVVTVAIFRSRASAQLASSALEAAGVPSWLSDELPARRTALSVRSGDIDVARELLAATEDGLDRHPRPLRVSGTSERL